MFGDEGGTRHSVRLDGRRCTMHCTPRRIAIADAGDVLHDIEPGSITSYFREESRITIAYSEGGPGDSGGSDRPRRQPGRGAPRHIVCGLGVQVRARGPGRVRRPRHGLPDILPQYISRCPNPSPSGMSGDRRVPHPNPSSRTRPSRSLRTHDFSSVIFLLLSENVMSYLENSRSLPIITKSGPASYSDGTSILGP